MPYFEISTQRANLFLRLAALCYDWLLILGLWMLVGFAAVAIQSLKAHDFTQNVSLTPEPVLSFWLSWVLLLTAFLYFVLFWYLRGQTPGMSAWRIILRNHSPKNRLGFMQASLRALLASFSMLCFGLGYIWCMLSPASHCWHDLLSGTRIWLLLPHSQP